MKLGLVSSTWLIAHKAAVDIWSAAPRGHMHIHVFVQMPDGRTARFEGC